jgi:uncharacterized protein (TIRG00374 family)
MKLRDVRLNRLLRPLAVIIPLAIAGNIIYIVAASEPQSLKSLGSYNIWYLILSVVLVFIPWVTHGGRVYLWNHAFGKDMRPSDALKTVVANDIGSAITPTAVGGGYVKLGFLVKYGFSPGEATLVTLLGSIEDGAFFAVAIPLAVILTRAWTNSMARAAFHNLISHWPLLVIAGAGVLAAYAIWTWIKARAGRRIESEALPKGQGFFIGIKTKLRAFRDEFLAALMFAARNGKRTFGLCVFLSGIGWSCRYGAISALVAGLGYKSDPVLFFLLQWIVFTTMTLIPTPGAVGGAEMSFAIVFGRIVHPGLVPILTGAWRFITFYLVVIVGALYLSAVGIGSGKKREYLDEANIPEEVKA